VSLDSVGKKTSRLQSQADGTIAGNELNPVDLPKIISLKEQ